MDKSRHSLMNLSSGGKEGTLEEIIAGLAVLSGNPYVAAVIFVLKIYGYISDAAFKQRVEGELKEIRERLKLVETKVDAILSITTRLPHFIVRAIDENTKKEILSEVWSNRLTVESLLANYVKGGKNHGKKYSDQDAEDFHTLARNTLTRSYQLSQWGQDAHVGVAFGYSTFLFIVRSTGTAVGDPHFIRNEIHRLIVESGASLTEARVALQAVKDEALLDVQRINDQIPRKILLCERSYTIYYTELLGQVDTGFSFARPPQFVSYVPPEGYVWPGDNAPWLASLQYLEENQVMSDLIALTTAEEARRREKIPKQETFDELDALIKSADALAKAVLIEQT